MSKVDGSTDIEGLTELLCTWKDGNDAILDKLSGLTYADLRRMAAYYLSRERRGHTLQPTALVNETWLRLLCGQRPDWQNRSHFFAVAARIMRRTLVDYVRAHPQVKVPLDPDKIDVTPVIHEPPNDLFALDKALARLARLDPRKAQIVEHRFFLGLSAEQTAEAMGLSEITIKREWLKAKAWLFSELSGGAADERRTMASDR